MADFRRPRIQKGVFGQPLKRGDIPPFLSKKQKVRDGHHIHYSYDSYGNLSVIKYYTNSTDYYVYYVMTNVFGDVVSLHNANGTMVVSYEYDAWGNVISMTDSTSIGIGTINPIRYRGYYFDEETGLYYLSSRYYDPETGRFINADGQISGIGEDVRGYNLFAYCFNNPVNKTDSSGCWPEMSTVFITIAATAAVVAVVAATIATCGAAAPATAILGVTMVEGISAGAAMAVASGACATAAVAATAAAVCATVENSSYQGPIRDQSVYVMRDKNTNEVQYVGRTNNPLRRQAEHARDPQKANLLPMEIVATDLSKTEARGMAQIVISAYMANNLLNARREIAVSNVRGFSGKLENVIKIFGGTVENEFLCLMER